MKARYASLVFFFLITLYVSEAQVPGWEGPIQLSDLPSESSVMSAYSNGYGQHLLVQTSTTLDYFLLGNNGDSIYTASPFPVTAQNGSITGYQNRLYIALDISNQIKVYSSINGGQAWSASSSHSVPSTVRNVDAFADARGCHIVWDAESADEVYYVLYDPDLNTFNFSKHVTDGSETGKFPKVLTTGDQLIVSFVTTHLSTDDRGATLDADLSGGPPDWDDDPLLSPSISVDLGGNQSIAVAGDSLHMLLFQQPVGNGIYRVSRSLSADWTTPRFLTGYGSSENDNFRRHLIARGDTLYAIFSSPRTAIECHPFNKNTIEMRMYTAPAWSSGFVVQEYCPSDYHFWKTAISVSATGQYLFWNFLNDPVRWMARRINALSGATTENMFWTGNNWVTGDFTIQSGDTVTLKPGSVTYVSDNKKIIVANGGCLFQEPGSQMVWGTGAKFQLNTTLLNQWNMTGIPVVVADFDTSAVYPTKTSYVFSYHSSYVIEAELENDRGYYVKFGSAQPIAYEGGYLEYTLMNAYNGWNIIGSISAPIPVSRVFSNPEGIVTSAFFRYEIGYIAEDTLKPGGGYWVQTDEAGEIVLDNGGNVDPGRGVPGALNRLTTNDPPSFDTYDRFTVADAAGGRQHLYVRNAVLAGTAANMEMPPPMPDSSFDVRFSPGDILQSVEPDSEGVDLSIALNAVTYPAELSWEINPQNGLTYTLPGGGSIGKSRSSSIVLYNRGNGFIRLNVSNRRAGDAEVPTRFGLHQNYPNPFNPSTIISYNLPKDSRVTLKVFDVLGREVATLVDGVVKAGFHQALLNAGRFASGLYFYRIQAGSFTSTRKMVVLK